MEGLPAVLSLILALLIMAMAVFAAAALCALLKGCFACATACAPTPTISATCC